uniref:DSHCT domain-containing protein n=1 Tax=Anisakis simplex TaxID=6269 RepID=A0A0M3KKE5_ANISI
LELNDVIHREAESLSGDFVELSWWMQEESERGIGLSEQLIKTAHISILDCDERVFERNRDGGNEAIESAILFAIQLVYKRLVDDGEEKTAKKTNDAERLLDRMSRLFGVMMAVDLSKV